MEALGAAGSIVGLLTGALTTTKSLKTTIDQWKGTTDTIRQQNSAFDGLHSLLIQYLEIESRTGLENLPNASSLKQSLHRCIEDLSIWRTKLARHKHEGSGVVLRLLQRTWTAIGTDELRSMWPVFNSHVSTLQSHLDFIQLSLAVDHTKLISQLPQSIHSQLGPKISEITNISSLQNESSAQLLDQHMEIVNDKITNLQSINFKQYNTIMGLLQEISASQFQTPTSDMLSEAIGTEAKLRAGGESIGEGSIQSCLKRLYALAEEKNKIIHGDENNPKAAQSIIEDLKKILLFASTALDIKLPVQASTEVQMQPRRVDLHKNETQALKRSFQRVDRILDVSVAIALNPESMPSYHVSPAHYDTYNICRAVESNVGDITMLSSIRRPKNKGKKSNAGQLSSGENDITETFSGYMSHLYKDSQQRFKMIAIFHSKLKTYESSCLHPQLVFCAVIPANSAVFQRIKEGKLDDLVKLLELGVASLTDCDPEGRSLLNYACNSAKSEICKFLIDKGANVDSLEMTNTKQNAYHKPLISQMIQNSDHGESSLKCHRLFLEAGADPTVGSSEDYSIAIEDAARTEKVNLVATMLAHGKHYIDLEARYSDGNTLLLVSLQGSCNYLGTAIELLRHGANVHARNNQGETCLLVMSNCYVYKNLYYSSRHTLEGRCQSFKDFLILAIKKHGADIDAVDEYGYTISRNVYRNKDFPDESWEDALAATGHNVADVLAKHLRLSGWEPSQEFPKMPLGDLQMLRKLSSKYYQEA